jgi:hypothetical protein
MLLVLGVTAAGCGSVQTNEPDADTSSGPDAAPDIDAVGGADAMPSIDATPGTAPETTIDTTPADPINSLTAVFTFSSDQGGSTFRCREGAAAFAPCTSPTTVTVNSTGTHTFDVYATYNGVDDATPASFSWTVDTAPPAIAISSGPADPTTSSNANFAFAAEVGATVACRLGNAAFGSCDNNTSMSYTGITPGSYTFQVRATDAATNQATASYSWTVQAPCTPILIEAESLPGTGWGTAFGSVLSAGQALDTSTVGNGFSFTFQGRGLVIAYRKGPTAGAHSVKIDSANPVVISATDSAWSYQNEYVVATGLANTAHTATVTCTQSSCQVDFFRVTCN